MQTQIENNIFKLYKHILLKSNFQKGNYYSEAELLALCKKITKLQQHLLLLTLQTEQQILPRTKEATAKIQEFACKGKIFS